MQDIFFNIFFYTDIIIFNKITLNIFNNKHYWINNFKYNDLPIPDNNIVTGKDYYKTYMKIKQSKEKMINLRKELENNKYKEKIARFHFTLNTNVALEILTQKIKHEEDFVYLNENNIEIHDIIPNDVILELKSKTNVLYANFGVLSHYININLGTGKFYYEISNCYQDIIGEIPFIQSKYNIPLNDINNYIIKLFYTYDKMDNFEVEDELGFNISFYIF